MTKQIAAVVFDRDGVISQFDIERGLAYLAPFLPVGLESLLETWHIQGEQLGWPKDLKQERFFFRQFWERLSAAYELNADAQQKLFAFDYLDYLVPYPEVRPVLTQLRTLGYRIGVLSNFTLASLEPSLEALQLDDLVDAACAATVIGVSKPEVGAYQTVAARLGVEPEECLFFDDETECVQGALNAGMTAYLVCRTGDLLPKSTPMIRDLTEVPRILHQLSVG